MQRHLTYALLLAALLPAHLLAQDGVLSQPISPTAITPNRIDVPTIGGGGGVSIQAGAIGATNVRAERITASPVGGGESIRASGVSAPKIRSNSEFNFNRHKTNAPIDRKFDYTRYNRFSGGSAPTGNDRPRTATALRPDLYPEQNERSIRVQSLNPSLGGYEVTGGYTYAPDMSEDNWIWLPLGAR